MLAMPSKDATRIWASLRKRSKTSQTLLGASLRSLDLRFLREAQSSRQSPSPAPSLSARRPPQPTQYPESTSKLRSSPAALDLLIGLGNLAQDHTLHSKTKANDRGEEH